MNNLFRTVFHTATNRVVETCDFSPITSLVNTMETATLNTPCRRLSLSSSPSDTSSEIPTDFELREPIEFTPDKENISQNVGKKRARSETPQQLKIPRMSTGTPTFAPGFEIREPIDFSPEKENVRKKRARSETPKHLKISRMSTGTPVPKLKKARRESPQITYQYSSPAKVVHKYPSLRKDVHKYSSPVLEVSPVDKDSRDSGYCESGEKLEQILLKSPRLVSRLNLDMDSLSPQDMQPPKIIRKSSERRQFGSLLSMSIDDDAFLMDIISQTPSQQIDITNRIPVQQTTPFDSLITAPFTETPVNVNKEKPIRRCLSMFNTNAPRLSGRMGTSAPGPIAISSPKQVPTRRSFKRPSSPLLEQQLGPHVKRQRRDNLQINSSQSNPPFPTFSRPVEVSLLGHNVNRTQITAELPKLISSNKILPSPIMGRSHSESDIAIMKALKMSDVKEDLTGDLSRPLILPTITGGKHPDLKNIVPETMSDLLNGKYSDSVESFKVIDCRYPYEFKGGHIRDAVNWDTLESANDFFKSVFGNAIIAPVSNRRNIIVFHCEFSAERGPRAQRFIREADRSANQEQYPALHFPELYLLEGGYKSFYAQFPEMCTPVGYTRMLDKTFSEQMKVFRAKSRSFASESKFGKGRWTSARGKRGLMPH